MDAKILIVGTVPYNEKSTSRAFESYFSNMKKENLFQIFSNAKTPCKGHCAELYQITDSRLLKKRLKRNTKVGRFYYYDSLPSAWEDNEVETNYSFVKKLYRIGSNKTPLIYLLRKHLWKSKFWKTEELLERLDEFSPDCVFLAFSDDFFIPEIALFFAERYHIPIVSCIGDDYYFNDKFSLSPFYYIYKLQYRSLIRRVFAHGGSAAYISNKIRDKYNREFGLSGETVYLTSKLQRKPFQPINTSLPVISYFGNIRQGRNESLNEIAKALGSINPNFVLNVYSNQDTKSALSVFAHNPNVAFHGSVPYQTVLEKTRESDIVVIVEGFKKKHVNNTRYSLSTKAADALASGAQILTYGSSECGIIEYMQSTNASAVCTKKSQLVETILYLLQDEAYQKQNYDNAVLVTERNHTLESTTAVFEGIVSNAIRNYPSSTKRI